MSVDYLSGLDSFNDPRAGQSCQSHSSTSTTRTESLILRLWTNAAFSTYKIHQPQWLWCPRGDIAASVTRQSTVQLVNEV